jgi:phospholipid transport system substrate-binding protein
VIDFGDQIEVAMRIATEHPDVGRDYRERFHAVLLDVMRNAGRLGIRGREARIRPAMEAAFNLPAMTRIAVGPPWAQMTPAQQQALVAAFSDWSIATYANRFDGYSGESFQTQGESTLQNGDRLVRTQLTRPNDAPVQLNYLLRDFGGGQWQIVDIYLTGSISELASRRAEFTTILREGGPDRLVAELRQRTQEASVVRRGAVPVRGHEARAEEGDIQPARHTATFLRSDAGDSCSTIPSSSSTRCAQVCLLRMVASPCSLSARASSGSFSIARRCCVISAPLLATR